MIEVRRLKKVYGSTVAIENITFRVQKGEILGFLGPNGAGKTTTMRILAGAIPATAGTAKIAGYDVHNQGMEVKKRIGYLPETPPLYPGMTVEGFLNFVAQIKGVSPKNRSKRIKEVIKRCRLQQYYDVLIHKLSKGYRQRVGIAQAIVHNPPVIILDEPTAGLDPLEIIAVRELIRSLRQEHTIILSTHILPEVSMTCDRVTIINKGRVIKSGRLDKLMAQVTQSFSYELEIEGNTENLITNLEAIPGVSQVKLYSNPNTTRFKLEINCTPNQEPGQDIARVIVNYHGLNLYEMRRHRPSLEDIFLQLTA